jgi:hypothetical protein
MRGWWLAVLVGAIIPTILVSRAAGDDLAQMGVKELEDRVLEGRRAIKSGEFQIRVAGDSQNEEEFHIWLGANGDIRQEETLNGQLRVGILAGKYAYMYSGKPAALQNPDMLTIVERSPLAQTNPGMASYWVADPRVVMFVPETFSGWSRYQLDTFVSRGGCQDLAVRASQWQGLAAATVSFRDANTGHKFEYDVVPERGYTIVGWRMTGVARSAGSNSPMSSVMTCELTQVAPSIWYPTHVHFKSDWDGRTMADEQVTIVASHVNEPIDEKVFAVGWKLPPKRLLVTDSPYGVLPGGRGGTIYLWDGQQLRPWTTKDETSRRAVVAAKRVAASPGISNRTIALLATGALVVALATLGVMAWARKHGHLLDLNAAVSLLMLLAVGALWVRSYSRLDEGFLIYSVEGSEQVGVMDGRVLLQHHEPAEGVRGRPLRVSVRSTPSDALPPRFWPAMEKGRMLWPGARSLRAASVPGDSFWVLMMPVWQVGLIFALLPGVWLTARGRRFYRRRRGRCVACGYELRGNVSGVCPECGRVA